MGRPTISLCCIMKNEVMNLPKMLASVRDCFDAIHLVDTGSTDGSVELVTQMHHKGENPANCDLYLHHFSWVDDFSAARNFSFRQADTDYIMWLDLDDVLSGRENFIQFRNHAMSLSPVWVATYKYALDKHGKSICSFARERIVKRDVKWEWKYFVHEGLIATQPDGSPIMAQYATSWSINHLRSEEDVKKDTNRNLNMFKSREADLDPRMKYYYGKELFENKRVKEGLYWLTGALECKDLALHDRVLCTQYAAQAALQEDKPDLAILLCHQGLQLEPNRAEFQCLIADGYVKKKQLKDALPYYHAARNSVTQGNDAQMVSASFVHEPAYYSYPTNNLSRLYANLGDWQRAKTMAQEAQKVAPSEETLAILVDIEKMSKAREPEASVLTPTTDIWITCPAQGFYLWDENIAKVQGIGGSETAAVRMARELHDQTGRKVIVFNNRSEVTIIDGVEYRPAQEVAKYAAKELPALHIAWRHNMIVTPAPTYVWSHDLGFPGVEAHDRYEKVIALSEFHKGYLMGLYGVPSEKIWVSRNGIDPKRFEGLVADKVGKRVVFTSSPDRGLKEAILVMDEVRKQIPDAEFHAYYGFDNMQKMGKTKEINELQNMCLDRSWVHFHGNIEQSRLAVELAKSSVWLYPTWFQETFCISALEAVLSKVYPVVRKWGALPDTLCGFHADVIDSPCETVEHRALYAERVVLAFKEEKWLGVTADAEKLSWKSVAADWIEYFGLRG